MPERSVWLQTVRMTRAQGSSLHDVCSKGATGQMKVFKFEMASFWQFSFQTTNLHPNTGLRAAELLTSKGSGRKAGVSQRSQYNWRWQFSTMKLQFHIKKWKQQTPRPPSCKLKLVLWETETRHTPDGYAGISHVHNGSLSQANYRTGAGKKKKVPELLQWWNVSGGSSRVVVLRSWEEAHLYPSIVLWLHLLSSTSFRHHKGKISPRWSATTKLMSC